MEDERDIKNIFFAQFSASNYEQVRCSNGSDFPWGVLVADPE